LNGPEPTEPNDLYEWLKNAAPDFADDLGRLQHLVQLLDNYHRERWQRHVAIGDAVTDRWARASQLGFGEGSSVYDSALVLGDVRVGTHTWVGPNTVLDGSGGLTIGDWCSISAGVQIYTHDSVSWAVSGGKAPIGRTPTEVGSNTYIGPNAIINRGLRVGMRCIIGASSLVLEDVPDGSVAHGIPASVVESTEDFVARHGSEPSEDGGR
jgi:acetyltransferase-like isoleucine patch superfamily enzyme